MGEGKVGKTFFLKKGKKTNKQKKRQRPQGKSLVAHIPPAGDHTY